MQRFVIANGAVSEKGLVLLDADDEGLLLGCSVFETLRTYSGELYGIEPHLERLVASCHSMNIPMPDEGVLVSEMEAAAGQIDGEAVVRVTLTAGGVRVVRAATLPSFPSQFRCVTRHFVPPAWLDGTVKHSSRGISREAVRHSGVDEVIWTDADGNMLEGTRCNIIAVQNGTLVTPHLDGTFLAGVTRSTIVECAVNIDVPVQHKAIHQSETFDELYVCSTLKELTPIVELNGEVVGGAGPIGDRVLDQFQKEVGRL
jgi:branched-subunit amino acid aminotransferase/4-amino-4-deoxychorismate lyase